MPISHIVKKGECLSTIAARYGFGDWRKVYNHPDNAEFRRKRPNPNILFPGDSIVIPEPLGKQVTVSGNALHGFKLKAPKTMLHLKVMQDLGGAAAGGKYEITLVGNAEPLTGAIGGDGIIDLEIPASAVEAKLTVLHGDSGQVLQSFTLQLGMLDPLSEVSGLQAYLNRLGFYTGPVDSEDSPQIQSALENFQVCYDLQPTGEADEATRKKLAELCGC